MIARDLISEAIPSLKTSDTGQTALNWMEIFRISHLPIVNSQDFLGLISDSDIYDINQPEEPIGNHKLTLFKPYVYLETHIFDVIGIASKMKLTVVPVLDEKKHYKGVVLVNDLVGFLAKISGLELPGGIIVLEMLDRDYSLAKISHIVESNNARILSAYITSESDSTRFELTLKINTVNMASVIRTFERYGYEVKTWVSEDDSLDKFYSDRFDMFMKYLDI